MTIDEVHRLVVAANPVPDPGLLEPVDMPEPSVERRGIVMAPTSGAIRYEQEQKPAPARPGLRTVMASLAMVVALVVAVWSLLPTPSSDLLAGRPVNALDRYVRALQERDVSAATDALAPETRPDMTEWLIGTDTSSIEVGGCEVNSDQWITCTVSFGPAWFYSRIGGRDMVGILTGTVVDDGLHLSMVYARGMLTLDNRFEAWVQAAHPDRYDVMFDEGTTRLGIDSGLARTGLADEYLASLD